MNPYRLYPHLEHWSTEAIVRGPLGPVVLAAKVLAINEEHAVSQHREDLQADGFELLADVVARRV